MVDHAHAFRPVTRPNGTDDSWPPPIRPTESEESNLSTSWIDLHTTTENDNSGIIESENFFERVDEDILFDLPIVMNDLHFADPTIAFDDKEETAPGESSVASLMRDGCHTSQSHPQHHQQESPPHQEENPRDAQKSDDGCDEMVLNQRFVEIIDTHYETIEGYDWEGILKLGNRMKQQKEEQQQERPQSMTAVRNVTDFKLYLTDGHLEEPTEEASLALDYTSRYNMVDDGKHYSINHRNEPSVGEGFEQSHGNKNNYHDFVEFVESPKHVVQTEAQTTDGDYSKDNVRNDEEGYATLDLSPLDVLTNSLLGARAFHDQHHHNHSSVRLTELIVGGPSLKLGESSIERLARAMACCCGALKRLVLIVSAVDLPAMMALADCFRANGDSLEDLHFYASQTTERLVASRSRYAPVPAPCVLGPGISSWVDAWTSGSNHNNSLRSLNLSRMDIGDEAAFALSRLLLGASGLQVLNLAQDDLYAPPRTNHLSKTPSTDDGSNHQSLSFAGTKRLLESLILIEDMKSRSLSSSISSQLACSNLLELDISGWVLEDEKTKSYDDDDDDKAVDDFYDDYNYIDDGSGEDDFEFAEVKTSNRRISDDGNRAIRKNQRPSCVIASMLRVNTALRKLILVAEDDSYDTNASGVLEANRGVLSVRSTLAIARALRDHVSRTNTKVNTTTSSGCSFLRKRSLGSNLRTLVLSTNYTHGMTAQNRNDTSSWAIAERKRAVAKIFYQALKDRPIQELRLQELSFTRTFLGLEPFGDSLGSTNLQDQLEFFLQQNRAFNQSLEKIESFWIPKISSLDDNDFLHSIDGDGNEDDDCHLVEVIESDANATEEQLAAAAERCSRLNQMGQQKTLPPIIVRALPTLLARANKEVARYDAIFHSTRTLANRTNLWEMTTHYRCDIPLRHLPNRQCRDD